MKKRVKCSVPDCNRDKVAKGYCDKHYRRFHKHGSLEVKSTRVYSPICTVPYCNETHRAYGLCTYHYSLLNKNGSPFTPRVVSYCGWQDCNEVHYAKGLCVKHYGKWRYLLEQEGIGDKSIYQ